MVHLGMGCGLESRGLAFRVYGPGFVADGLGIVHRVWDAGLGQLQ